MKKKDLISRQDVIDAISKLPVKVDDQGYTWMIAINVLNQIDDIPSAEPGPKWTACNAQMPEEREWLGTKQFGTTISDEVYVTFENPKGERFCKHLSFQNGKLSRFDQSTIDAFYPEAKPIAWMPLPEPWRGE